MSKMYEQAKERLDAVKVVNVIGGPDIRRIDATDIFTQSTSINGSIVTQHVKFQAELEKEKEQFLKDTESMRVVALNEACGIAKANVGTPEEMSAKDIVGMAKAFADFLIKG